MRKIRCGGMINAKNSVYVVKRFLMRREQEKDC